MSIGCNLGSLVRRLAMMLLVPDFQNQKAMRWGR